MESPTIMILGLVTPEGNGHGPPAAAPVAEPPLPEPPTFAQDLPPSDAPAALSEQPLEPLAFAPLSAELIAALAPPELVFAPPGSLPVLAPLLESPAKRAVGEELEALQAAIPELMVSALKTNALNMRLFMGALERSTAAP